VDGSKIIRPAGRIVTPESIVPVYSNKKMFHQILQRISF
jgi:hypothetical protein